MSEAFVRLTDADRSEYAKTMARHWTRVEELREKKANDAKRTQGQIDEELEEIGRCARVVNDDGESRNQLDLFADQQAAASALAEVAKRTDEPPAEPTEEDQIKVLAQEFITGCGELLPESRNETNQRLTGFFATKGVPSGQRKRIRDAVKALLEELDKGPVLAGPDGRLEGDAGDAAEAEA